jgi:hypothetical protein
MVHRRLARIRLVIDLDAVAARLPEPQVRCLAGVTIPCLSGVPDGMFARALARYLSTPVLAE